MTKFVTLSAFALAGLSSVTVGAGHPEQRPDANVTAVIDRNATSCGSRASATEKGKTDTSIQAETCSVCVSNCYRIYELESEKCVKGRQYRTNFAVNLCRAEAANIHGRCLKRCNHSE
jgi:hypothetical protein